MEKKRETRIRNIKNLFKFETKDIWWILFFILIIFVSWSYYSETKICKNMVKTECYLKCQMDRFVQEAQVKGLQTVCDIKTYQCQISGYIDRKINFVNNISLMPDENNSKL